MNVRIIAATNRDIEQMVADGGFREDLFYRLNVLHIKMPSLRERREDLPGLVRFFIQRESERLELEQLYDIDPAAEDVLISLDWPGNLREMQNVIARALILADNNEITVADLPPQVTKGDAPKGQIDFDPSQGTLREQVRQYEIKAIQDAVAKCGGDRQAAAKSLGIGISTLYRKLEETGS